MKIGIGMEFRIGILPPVKAGPTDRTGDNVRFSLRNAYRVTMVWLAFR